MEWKRLVSGVLSLAVVAASLVTAAVYSGRAAEEDNSLLYQQVYEAEDGTTYEIIDGALVAEPRLPATEHIGYTGRGFLDQMNNQDGRDGRAVTIKVTVPSAGRYMLGVRYAGSQAATMGVYVGDDASKAQTMRFGQAEWNDRGFAAWKTWLTSYTNLDLEAGENDITIISRKDVDTGVVNLDSISLTDSVVYEAEDAEILPNAKEPNKDHIGFSGRGFVAAFSNNGEGLQFKIDVPRTGVYAVAFTYQSATNGNRDLNLYLNDAEQALKVEFPKNGDGWEKEIWSQTYVNLSLNAGENTIRLIKEDGNNGGFNIDCMTVSNRLLTAYPVENGITNGNFEKDFEDLTLEGWTLDNTEEKSSGINAADNDAAVGRNLYMWNGGKNFSQGISQQLTGLDNGWYVVSFWKQNNDIVPNSQLAELVAGEKGVSARVHMPYTTAGIWKPMTMAARTSDGSLKIHTSIDGNMGSSLMVGKFQLWRLVDKTELYDQIASGSDLRAEDYTSETWQAYEKALKDANDAMEKATLQSIVDKAKNELNNAQTLLDEKPAEEPFASTDQTFYQLYESEDAELLGGALIQDEHAGFTGTGFAAQLIEGDRGVAYTVHVPRSGNYMIGVRYATDRDNTYMAAYVGDDSANAQNIFFANTKSWKTWSTAYFNIQLSAGENKITLLHRKDIDEGVANIDHITVTESTLYEAENATILPEHRNPATDHVGYSGKGFMAGFDGDGKGMEFSVEAARPGTYSVAFSYQSAQSNTHEMHVYVNDETEPRTLYFPQNNRAGNWADDNWSLTYIDLPLKEGKNVIRIIREAGMTNAGNINIDYMAVPNRLLTQTEAAGTIVNGGLESEDLTGWSLDDPALTEGYVKVNVEASGLAGNTIRFLSNGSYQQGVSQEISGLANGWYAMTFQYLNTNTNVPNKAWAEMRTAAQGDNGYLQLPIAPTNIWMYRTVYAQVTDGKLTIHIGVDAANGSELMIGNFQLYRILDKTGLYDQIASGAELTEEGFTPDTWKSYAAALSAARTVMESASSQKEIDDAATALYNGQEALIPVPGVHSITLIKPEDAQITLSANSASAGTMVTVAIDQLPTGRVVDTVTVKDADNGDITVLLQPSGVYAFQMPDKAVTVTVILKAETFAVSAQAGENGTVDPVTQTVEYGQDAVFTLQPDAGYLLDAVTISPQTDYEVQDNKVIVKGVVSETSVQITFKAEEKPVLTIKSVAAVSDVEVAFGTTYAELRLPNTVEVTLSNGAKADATVKWDEGEYDGQKAGEYVLSGALTLDGVENPDDLAAAVKVTVKAKQEEIATYTVIAKAGANGSITPAEVTVEDGKDAVFTVKADEGYEIAAVTVTPEADYTLEDGILTIKSITANTEVALAFKAISQPVDTTQLEQALKDANALLDKAVAGDGKGQYPESAITEFHAAVEKAQNTLDDPNITAEDVIASVRDLEEAQEVFLSAQITEDPESSDSDTTDSNSSDVSDSHTSSDDTHTDSSYTSSDGSTASNNEISGNANHQNNGTHAGSNNPQTSNAIPSLAIGALLASGAALWVVSRKRRG